MEQVVTDLGAISRVLTYCQTIIQELNLWISEVLSTAIVGLINAWPF